MTAEPRPDFLAAAARLHPELVRIRRALHADPEVGLTLPRTQRRVVDEIEQLGLEVRLGTACTSVVAVLRGSSAGPAVLLRGDMDALPVVEGTDLPYRSTNGAMHACGHDLHTAALIGAARLLAGERDRMAGSVVFMFQPGEEGHDGAERMIEEGVLEAAGQPLVGAYGVHVIASERGIVETRPGPLMAGANTLRITVHGRGGHGSKPSAAVDPVPAIVEIATALQTLVTRAFDVADPVVLSVTQLSAGDAINVIPPRASLGATIRTLSVESTERIRVESARMAEHIAAAHRCEAEVEFRAQFPVTVNDDTETESALRTVAELLGPDRVRRSERPMMGSEDFSLVLQQVPGTYLFLGARPTGAAGEAATAWNHSPQVEFDDGVLGDEAAVLAALAWERLYR